MAPSNQNHLKSQEAEWCALAKKARGGDKKAYSQLLRELAPYIKGLIVNTLANPDWADDITQEVLISVHRSLDTYDGSKPFKPWLRAIIQFRRADFLRKYYSSRDDKSTSLDNPEFLNAHVTDPGAAGEYIDVEAALDELPPKQRKVFEMMKIKGFSAKDVANELGMSVSAVKVSAHRTMSKLKDRLQ